jgi:hypothetical protein
MNLLEAKVALRPRPLSEVLDLAVPFCLLARRPLLSLALLALGPVGAAALLLRPGQGWGWAPVWLLVLGAAFFVEGIFTVALGEALFRRADEVRVRAAAGRFLRRLPLLLLVHLVRLPALAVCAALPVLLPIEAPRWLFVGEALLLEHAGPGRAMARSRALARDRGLFCLGLWLATLGIPVLGAVLGDLIGNAVTGFVLQLGHPVGRLWDDGGSAFAVLGALAAVPVAAAARFLGYIDIRTRSEGWDIQIRFMALAAADPDRRRRAA